MPSAAGTASALQMMTFSVLITLPTRAAINASPTASRLPAHDSRASMNWLFPLLQGTLSGRALARAPLGGGFPALPFRLQGGFSVPPSATFPAALPKIRTSGFPTVRLQASGTLQFGTELSAAPPRLRLIRPCPRALPAFSPSFDDPARRRGTPPLCAAPPRRPRRHLCPEVLAPSGLCCPGLPRLPTSSASQENSRPFPGIRRL